MTADTVLVVEDDEDIRDSLVELLHEHGYAADGVTHGREALDRIAAGVQPCLIVLDLMMPVMDGHEFRRLQLLDPAMSHIPVVVMSAIRDLDAVASTLNAAAILKKPLRLDDLLGVVARHCPCGQEV